MQTEESQTDLGSLKIHKNAIASIAALAATETEGVKRVGGDFRSTILQLTGRKAAGAIRVEIDKNGDVRLEIPLVVKYGFNIPEVAGKAQESIRAELEKMTNLAIKDININIQVIERG